MLGARGAKTTGGGCAWWQSGDDTKQRATLLGLQVQSFVARVNFSHEKTRDLYQTLGEQSKKLSSFSASNLQNNFLVLCAPPSSGCQAQGMNVSKNNYDDEKNNNAIKYIRCGKGKLNYYATK
jgi:hypothetical protein